MADKRNMKTPTGAILSKYLRAMALDIETMSPEGDVITKAAALAQTVWKYALGFEEPADPHKPDGPRTKIPPAVWAIEVLYNRIEGKIPVAVVEDQGRSLTDKVSDLGKAKINAMTRAAAEQEEEDAPENAD